MKDFYVKNKSKISILAILTVLAFATLETPYINIVSSRIISVLLVFLIAIYVIVFSVPSRFIFFIAGVLFFLLPFLAIFRSDTAAEFFGIVIYILIAIGIIKNFIYYLKNL